MVNDCDQYRCDGKYIWFGVCDGKCEEKPTHFVRESSHESYCFCERHYHFYINGSSVPWHGNAVDPEDDERDSDNEIR